MNSSEAVTKRVARQRSLFKRNELAQPFLKWAGGKRQLLPELRKLFPKKFDLYFEPFVGAGAVFFDLQPSAAVINDANKELINCYRVIKAHPEELIKLCKQHADSDTEDYFYRLRALDREPSFHQRPEVERAARIIYLNKTCYNGLFRVNSQGHFNVPYGHYEKPQVVVEAVIRAVSNYLNEAQIGITDDDYKEAVSGADSGDFVYFDPPYDPLSDTSSFTGYNLHSFGKKEQEGLRDVCNSLTDRGCKVLISNSATKFIYDLYNDACRYTIREVGASRSINSVATGRGKITEFLIFNKYDV